MSGGRERVEGDAETLQQRVGEVPVGLGQALARPRRAAVLLGTTCRQGRAHPFDAERRRRPAQHADLEHARRMLHGFARKAEAHERMREQRQKPHGPQVVRRRFGGKPREASGRRVGERNAGGILDGEAPAGEFRRHARGERAVGRDERGGPVGMGDGFAQRDRDGEGLLALVHGFHDGKALAAAPAQRRRDPRLRSATSGRWCPPGAGLPRAGGCALAPLPAPRPAP